MRALLSTAAFLCLPLVALSQGAGWRANPSLVARESAQRPDTNYDESRVPQTGYQYYDKPGLEVVSGDPVPRDK